jgi:hypothetical protein
MMTAAAYGGTLAIGLGIGWCAAIAFYRTWRVNADVLSHVPPAPPFVRDFHIGDFIAPRTPTTGSGVRPRAYHCGVCATSDRGRYARCQHPLCPDGRDQVRR